MCSYVLSLKPAIEHVCDSPHSEAHGQAYHLNNGHHKKVT